MIHEYYAMRANWQISELATQQQLYVFCTESHKEIDYRCCTNMQSHTRHPILIVQIIITSCYEQPNSPLLLIDSLFLSLILQLNHLHILLTLVVS